MFCKAGFKFDVELSIDGLLAVTLDQKEVFLFNIKEIMRPDDSATLSVSCMKDSRSNDSSLAASTDVSDVSDCELKSDVCQAESGVENECDKHSAMSADRETDSSTSKSKVLHKVRRKQHSLKKVSKTSPFQIPALSNTLPRFSTELEANDPEAFAEDLSVKDGERCASSQVYADVCKLEVETDSSSNTDQYLTGLLHDDDGLVQHIKQEPSSAVSENTSLPFMSNLSSIRQRLGFMSQYIGMSQVVAGMHPGFISPSHAYAWPDHVLSPLAQVSAGCVSQAANQMVSS